MDKQEFLMFIDEEFIITNTAKRLISNILDYAEALPHEEQYQFLIATLDGTIGLSEKEIRQIEL